MNGHSAGSSTGGVRVFSMLNGLVLLGILLQGLWAGEFIGGVGGADWVEVHAITGYVVVLLSLVAAIVAVTTLRRRGSGIVGLSITLFVLLLIQVGLGQAISDGGQRALVAAHVPVALLAMALGVYLSVAGARLRHAS